MKRLRAAVLISGSGRTLQNFLDLSRRGRLPIEVVLVVSSRDDAWGLVRARRAGVPSVVIRRRDHADVGAFSAALERALRGARAELVLMAGYLCLWRIPRRWRHRVLNIHPALIPAFSGAGFYGDRVHEAVLASGARWTGCTVHFADDVYDHGPIILQRVVPVRDDDTPRALAERVFRAERRAYPEAIRLLAAGRLKVRGRRVYRTAGSTRTRSGAAQALRSSR